MEQKIHAMATALVFFSESKEKRTKRKDVGFFGKSGNRQSTNRLLLRPSAEANASLITMTGKGKAVQLLKQKAKGLRQKAICWKDRLVGQFRKEQITRRPFDSAQGDVEEEEVVLFRQEAESLRQKAICWTYRIIGHFRQEPLTNRLLLRPSAEANASLITMTVKAGGAVPLRQNAKSLRHKAICWTDKIVGQFRQKQSTNRLSLRPSSQPTAPLITMTGGGEEVQFNNDTLTTQSHATGSAGLVKRRAGSMASGLKDRFTLIFWVLFDLSKKYLGLPPAMRREDFKSKEPNLYKEIITTPFNSPVRQLAEVHWAQTYRVGKPNSLKAIGKLSQKQLTNRLSLRSSAQTDASLITMTGEGRAAVQLNHDTPTTQSHATGSAGPVKRRAGSWPVRMKDRFTLPFWFLFWLRKTALAILRAEKNQTITRKKELALPPAMRREDFQSKEKILNKKALTTPFNSPVRQLTEVHWAQTCRVENGLKQGIRPFSKMQLTNRLSICPGAEANAPLITIMAKRRGIAVKLRPNILMAFLIIVVITGGTPAKAQTKALQIGDTIPEAIWNTPLQIVNHPEGKSSIRLGDYKGKLIILDFWATWCVNCVKSFPEEGRLQKEFEDRVLILPVTTQKQSIVNAFMQRDNPTKGSHLTVVTDDQLLSSTFKHQLMPHVVWIDGKGRFVASTAASYVQAEKIQQVLGQQKLDWTMKRDFLEFDKTDALMGWMDHGGTAPEIFGYSAFTGHLWGVDPVSGIQAVTGSNSQRRYDINVPLQIFSVRAYGGNMPVLSKKQYLYQVSKIQDYVCPAGMPYIDWKVKHTYCYEAVLPGNYSGAQIRQKMREDLKSYFGLEGKLEYRKVGAWVFHKQGTGPQTAGSGSQSLASLIWQLNEQHPELPLAVDSTGSNNLQVPKMEASSFSLVALNKALKPYGISVEAEESEQPFFVLYESDIPNAKPKQ